MSLGIKRTKPMRVIHKSFEGTPADIPLRFEEMYRWAIARKLRTGDKDSSGRYNLPWTAVLHDEEGTTPETPRKIERVAGVDVNSDDGEEIVRISFDPFRLAQLGVTIDQIAQTVNRSTDVTGGSVEVGRRNYTMRFEGRYSAEQLGETILAWRNGAPIRLNDVAKVSVGNDRRGGVVYQNGNPAIGMRVLGEPGANTLTAIDAITKKVDELNSGPLAEMGYSIQKSFDPSLFIKNALSMLTGNLMLGVLLGGGAARRWWPASDTRKSPGSHRAHR